MDNTPSLTAYDAELVIACRPAARRLGPRRMPARPATRMPALDKAADPAKERDLSVAAEASPSVLEDLIVRVAGGHDRAAFALLFDHFAPRLKAFLLRQGTGASTAEELVQEAMLTVWRKAASFDPAQATASTWIFTIARNKRIDLLRRERRPELDPNDPLLVPESTSAERSLGAREEATLVRQAMTRLPPEQADLVRMAYFEDKVHTAIADETGLPLGTVKSRLRLALNRLAKLLKEV